MKHNAVFCIILCLGCLSLTPPPTDDEVPVDLLFATVDANSDGKLDIQELTWRVFVAHALHVRDSNHDGRVSASEAFEHTTHSGLWKKQEHPVQQRKQDLDAGEFSFTRLMWHMVEARHEDYEQFLPDLNHSDAVHRADAHLKSYDSDHDGLINGKEYDSWLHNDHLHRYEKRYNIETHTKLAMGKHHEPLHAQDPTQFANLHTKTDL